MTDAKRSAGEGVYRRAVGRAVVGLHPVGCAAHPGAGRSDPRVMRRATVAIEDRRFYERGGLTSRGSCAPASPTSEEAQAAGRLDAGDAADQEPLRPGMGAPGSAGSARPSWRSSSNRSIPVAPASVGSSPATSTACRTARWPGSRRSASRRPPQPANPHGGEEHEASRASMCLLRRRPARLPITTRAGLAAAHSPLVRRPQPSSSTGDPGVSVAFARRAARRLLPGRAC